jgi:hypothetical protein
MVIAFSVGSKCAIMLPRELINEQLTPARGMVINRLVGNRSLILVEEVWQFKGFPESTLSEMCFPKTGRIRDSKWGWAEVPSFLEEEDYLIVPAEPVNMMVPSEKIFTAMIKRSIQDFKEINKLV